MEEMKEELRKEFRKQQEITLDYGQIGKSVSYLLNEEQHNHIADWWLKKLDLAVSKEREEKEMLADALLDMYGQYCSDGHMFMSAGEHASGVLEGLGYAKFDDAGAIINTK